MLANETRNTTDSLVLPYKWLALIGLTLLIGWGNAVSRTSITIVSIAAIWTLFLTLLLMGNKRLVFHVYI